MIGSRVWDFYHHRPALRPATACAQIAQMSTLTLRHVAIDTYKENVAYLHRECKLYHSEGFQALNKIEIHTQDGDASIIAVLNVVDDVCITTPDEGHDRYREATGLGRALGGRQTLYRRNPRESHNHAGCANRSRARHADT